MTTGDLTTLPNAKAWLGVGTSGDDALLTRLVTAASQYIQAWLNRSIASASYTDTFDGTGKTKLMLGNYPITAVASVTVDGTAIPASTGPTTPGYVFTRTAIMLRSYAFSCGVQNVVIAYTAGYTATPPELEQACIELIALRYRERDRIGQVSKSVNGEVVAFSQKDMSDDIKTILSNYKKVVPL